MRKIRFYSFIEKCTIKKLKVNLSLTFYPPFIDPDFLFSFTNLMHLLLFVSQLISFGNTGEI